MSHFTYGVDHTDKGARTLEVYVPLRFNSDAAPVGVYEVYLSYTPTEAAIAADTRTMYVVIAVGLLLVWAALYRIVSLASRRLRRQATHDALTGLPNRVLLEDRIERALAARRAQRRRGRGPASSTSTASRRSTTRSATPTATSCCARSAPRLREVLRHGDTLARLGGDEFAVLLPSVQDRAGRRAVAERLRDALHRSFSAGGDDAGRRGEHRRGAVAGPRHDARTSCSRNADIAMYSAKERKAGAVVLRSRRTASTRPPG